MAKLLKIVGKIIGSIYEWLLIILIVIVFAIRTSPVQTWLAEQATDFLSKELDTELRIEKVDIYFFDRVALDGVFVRDQKGDTLASLGSIEVVLQSLDLDGNAVTLRSIALENGRVGISRDSLTGDYNYFFITDYFDGGPKKNPKKEPIDLTIRSLDIEHVDITYDDNRKSWSDYGMDYDHLDLKDVVLKADDLNVHGNNVRFKLWHLSAKEKSGLHLKRLKATCDIGMNGILLSDVIINTSRSRIFASRFNLKMNGLQQVHTFIDSVTFDAVIDSSRINLRDVSYFAPELKGMHQRILLKAQLSQRVKDLKISGIDLRTGNRTIIRGNLLLPDFRSLDGSFLKESLDYAYIDLHDLQALRLPDKVEEHFIRLDPMIDRLGYFEVKRLDVIGYTSQFVLSSRHLGTQLGTLHLDNGLLFTKLDEGGYSFERSANSDYDVYIDSFHLGKFIDDPLFGKVNGSIFMSGVVGQKDVIRINKLDGIINSLGVNNYNYSNIAVSEGSYINNIFEAKIDITDPHLELAFDGSIDMNNGQKFVFETTIKKADLGKLNVTENEHTSLVTSFSINMQGTGLSNYQGTLNLRNFTYTEDSNAIHIPTLDLTLTRGATDHVEVRSDVADIDLDGQINPAAIITSVRNELSGPLSAYFHYEPMPRRVIDNNAFDLTVVVKPKIDEVLAVFAPKLSVAPGTKLDLHYDAPRGESALVLTSPQVMYDSILVRNLAVNQSILDKQAKAEIDAAYFELNDSLNVKNVDIDIEGTNNVFNTVAKWNANLPDSAKFAWKTTFAEQNRVDVLLDYSYFSVKGQLWEIQNKSRLAYSDRRLEIGHLVLEREEQFIAVNGVLSDLPEDKVTVDINALQLEEFSSFISPNADIAGSVNGNVAIYTPFTTFRAEGKVQVNGLIVNGEPVGDVYSEGTWDGPNSRVRMEGKLEYLKQETFDYAGYYYPYSETNNFDFKLQFKKMDLQFANAFIDPSLVSDIRGNLEGEISVKGKTESPVIDGELNLVNGNVKIAMLGVNFKASGPIQFDGKYSAFYIDNMPITDEEGNTASITAAINHTNFEKWDCDIGVNMEDDYTRLDYRGRPTPIDKFLVLNTRYDPDQVYYGRAYVTGTANIFVTEEHTSISVNAKTREGTWIDIPMYGNSELEESTVVRFEDKDVQKVVEEKIDLSSVDLDLNFDVTPDARLRLIFNEKTGDEIVAYGQGQIEIDVDSHADVQMTGTYEVDGRSIYNFVMGPIKQEFNIVSGGTIIWTGDPGNAALNLTAYNKVRANINEITPDLVQDSRGSTGNQEVRCVMYITQTLDDPLITLDIQAPNASDYGQAVLNNVRSNKEELQKQFFSLLLFKKFVPLAGQTTAGAGGLADVLTKQINSILAGMTEGDLKFNVDYDDDETTGDRTVKVGSQVSLGQNSNIILKGSFGVANSNTESQSQTNLVGDMSLEYLINADGSFRVNLFNESNETGVIQDKTQGLFTQGVGLHYQESFNSVDDFKLIQSVFDLFRKENRVKIKKRRREVKVFPTAEEQEKEEKERQQQEMMQNGVIIPPDPKSTGGETTPPEKKD